MEMLMNVAVFVIIAVQSLFFALGGIRDNFAAGKVVMPDEEYLQSWWHDTKLGESESHSARMETVANGWGTFIGTIALVKMAAALSGGNQPLVKTLAAIFIAANIWLIIVFMPMDKLMEAHWTNKKNNPAMENKGSVVPFCAMLGAESLSWLVLGLGGRAGALKLA
eukprot:CAMPEP_0119068598 /NCGR_PEP_ID=MMETSP1178-20130426/11043_1 /TAXON_ID=33656 /ORGANISM="unid sp, Strain CCMP2000" /LENGTH=165 /DNA_ID=CAMNT_0007050313 /DNA_START=71 /DNA_END=568 /DNA_ORIENTATION=-